MNANPDITYRLRGRIGGLKAGTHPSRATGSSGTFRDQVPFMAYPDARRIDVRATLRDPFQNTFVRRFQQRAAIDVWVLADLSGSMNYEGYGKKKDLILRLSVALARSATRIGDRFGLYACDGTIREGLSVPATRRPGIVSEVARRLGSADFSGTSADGLLQAAERLVGKGNMVFIVSDFLLPFDLLKQVFERLAQHDIVPVVLADSSEDLALPDWGLVELADLETGKRRLIFMRPKLKVQWADELKVRREAIGRLARQFGRAPVTITDTFDIDQFSRQLQEA